MLIILQKNLGTIIGCVIAYLIGSINFGFLISNFKKIDITNFGSGNPGATNISRYLGKKYAYIVAVLDGLKPVISAIICGLMFQIDSVFFSQTSLIIPAFFSLIGHCWPIFYKFKGGKAVASFVGILLVANWIISLTFIFIWLIFFKFTRHVSVASIFSSIICAILLWVPALTGNIYFIINGYEYFSKIYDKHIYLNIFNTMYFYNLNYFVESFLTINICITFSSLLLVIRHSSNIKKLFRGEELNYVESKKKAQEEIKKNNN